MVPACALPDDRGPRLRRRLLLDRRCPTPRSGRSGWRGIDRAAVWHETGIVERYLAAAPVRFTRGACRRIIRDYTSEPGVRELARCLRAICRQVVLGLETGDTSRVCDPVMARQVRRFLGAPGAGHGDGLDRLREQLDAPGLPAAVRERGRQVLARLSAWAPTDPNHLDREYLECLLSVPWTRRTATAPLDLDRRPGHPRRAPCGARRGQGAAARLRGGARVEPGRAVAGALPAGPTRGRQDDAGRAARYRARAGERVDGPAAR